MGRWDTEDSLVLFQLSICRSLAGMFDGFLYADFNPMWQRDVPFMDLRTGRENDDLPRYLTMNSSIDGTSSPTSFSIVLYCDKSLVHAGEYLLHLSFFTTSMKVTGTDSAAVMESRTYARSR
jgi:hypothetical protein